MIMPRFLIAKYAADLRRMEPRNFGVIVWSPHGVSAKFIGEQTDGKVRAAASIVRPDDRRAYKQWIAYWRAMIVKDAIMTRHGLVHRSSPEFPDVLRSKAKPQFLLVDGGTLLDEVAGADLTE